MRLSQLLLLCVAWTTAMDPCVVTLIRRTGHSIGCVLREQSLIVAGDLGPIPQGRSQQRAMGFFGCTNNVTIVTGNGCAGIFMCGNGAPVACGNWRSRLMQCNCSSLEEASPIPLPPPLPPTPPMAPAPLAPGPETDGQVAMCARWCSLVGSHKSLPHLCKCASCPVAGEGAASGTVALQEGAPCKHGRAIV